MLNLQRKFLNRITNHTGRSLFAAIVNSPIFKREIETKEDNDLSSSSQSMVFERTRYDSVSSSASYDGDVSQNHTLNRYGSIRRNKLLHLIDPPRSNESDLLKASNVFANEDGKSWDWDIITIIFQKVSYLMHRKFSMRSTILIFFLYSGI